ncbi:MAG TPA: hypothetical protein ENI76_10915 [Ignavibacteria bacterium]|mgnify:CR=1 FL=1|nr:hypothetical protein [Ignavibacteria bacterium]
MVWWICPDKCLDNYSSPDASGVNYLGTGPGEDVQTVQGNGAFQPMINANYCNPTTTPTNPVDLEYITGTTFGAFQSFRNWEKIVGGGLRLKTSFQHSVGPFGFLELPTSYRRWCRQWGAWPNLVKFYGLPWNVKPHFSPTFERLHLFISIEPKNNLPLIDGNGDTLQFKFDIKATVDLDTTLESRSNSDYGYLGSILPTMLYEFTGNSTPFVPNTGTFQPLMPTGNFSKWRNVNSDGSIHLILWIPNEGFDAGGNLIPQRSYFWNDPRLTIDINKLERRYRSGNL